MRHTFRKKMHAFTLIEMLIVVVIIGILAAVLVPRLVDAQARSRDASRTVKTSQISTAIGVYKEDKGSYPIAPFHDNEEEESTVAMIPEMSSYMTSIPTDPGRGLAAVLPPPGNPTANCLLTGDSFAYSSDPNGTMYAITSFNESKKGNTNNCLGVVNSNNATYNVLGKGLYYADIGAYDPILGESPEEWCINNLTSAEAEELENTTEDNTPSLSKNDKPKRIKKTSIIGKAYAINPNYFIEKWCNKEYIYWGADSLPNGIPTGLSKLIKLKEIHISNDSISSFTLSHQTLKYLNIGGDSLTSIHLGNLPNLNELSIRGKSLTSLQIPNLPNLNRLSIGGESLTTLSFPENIDNLSNLAINGTALKNIILPQYMSSLGHIYMSYNNSLESIVFPNSMPNVGSFQLKENAILHSITIPGDMNKPMLTYGGNFNLQYNPLLKNLGTSSACELIKKKGWTARVSNRGQNNVCPGY